MANKATVRARELGQQAAKAATQTTAKKTSTKKKTSAAKKPA